MKRAEIRRTAALVARTPLSRSSVPLRRVPMKRVRPKAKLPPKRRKTLMDRSGGACEMASKYCVRFATDACHRVAEGSGGRHGEAAEVNDRLSNVLHGCRACHSWCHAFPRSAELNGWALRMGDDPLRKRVNYRGEWSLLGDDGGVTPCGSS